MKTIKSISYIFRVTSQFMSIYTEGFDLPEGANWYDEAKKLNPNALAIHLSYKYNNYTDGTHD